MRYMYDASSPPGSPPAWDVVAGYIGGDTPHVWTRTEWAGQPARYRLPIWVQSDPTMNDGPECVTALRQLGVPTGVSVALDLETSSGSSYVQEFIDTLHAAGYQVLVYGSLSTVRGNPAGDGYWMAHYTYTAHLEPGSVATQYSDGTQYDSSLILDSVPLWDTHAPTPQEEQMFYAGQLNMGAKAQTSVSIRKDSCSGIGFLADNGLFSKPAVHLRVAISLGGGKFQVKEIAVDSAHGKTSFPLPAGTDGVSIQYLDAGDVPVGYDMS